MLIHWSALVNGGPEGLEVRLLSRRCTESVSRSVSSLEKGSPLFSQTYYGKVHDGTAGRLPGKVTCSPCDMHRLHQIPQTCHVQLPREARLPL